MNAASVLILVCILVLAALATWYCHVKGAPCEGGPNCSGHCAHCRHKCAAEKMKN